MSRRSLEKESPMTYHIINGTRHDVPQEVAEHLNTQDERIAKLEAGLRDLARCDYDHGFAEDTHSKTCRKCQLLNR